MIKYLGLPAGNRFLIDDKGFEDVWFDENLLTNDTQQS
ncbi:immunity protein Imm33 domain-containing protein [Chryseobacterium carnipullorum]